MGLASSLGLGIALALPRHKVVVIDGDGSLLMNLGTLSTLARYRPGNLLHIVFDNESLLSVGGFPTATATGTDLAGVARACGIPRVDQADTPEQLPTRKIKANAQARARPAVNLGDGLKPPTHPHPGGQAHRVGVVQVILLDAVPVVELELALQLLGAVAGRAHLEGDLRRNPPFLPLLV